MAVHVVPVFHEVHMGFEWAEKGTTAFGVLLAVQHDDETATTRYLIAAERNAAPAWVDADQITHVEVPPP